MKSKLIFQYRGARIRFYLQTISCKLSYYKYYDKNIQKHTLVLFKKIKKKILYYIV